MQHPTMAEPKTLQRQVQNPLTTEGTEDHREVEPQNQSLFNHKGHEGTERIPGAKAFEIKVECSSQTNFEDGGFDLAVGDLQAAEGDGKAEAARAGASGIEVEHAVAGELAVLVGVAADDGGESGGFGVEVEGVEVVNDVDNSAGEFDDFSSVETLGPGLDVDIAADGGDGRDFLERGNDLRIADVAGMDDVLRAAQESERFRTEQAVRVRDNANDHSQASESGFDAGVRIHEVAERVADEVERKHGQHDRGSREEHEMRRAEEVSAAVVEHGAPACGGRRNTESEKAHGGFSKDGASHPDCGLHDYRLNDVGKNVAREDTPVGGAESARGFDELALLDGQHLGADQAGVADPSADAERDDQIEDARAEKGHEGDGDENSGKRKECVHHDDVEETVGIAAVIAGDGAEDQAEKERSGDHAAAYEHGDASAVDGAGEDVAAELVGAEPVGGAWRLQAAGQVNVAGVLGRDPGGEDGKNGENDD